MTGSEGGADINVVGGGTSVSIWEAMPNFFGGVIVRVPSLIIPFQLSQSQARSRKRHCRHIGIYAQSHTAERIGAAGGRRPVTYVCALPRLTSFFHNLSDYHSRNQAHVPDTRKEEERAERVVELRTQRVRER